MLASPFLQPHSDRLLVSLGCDLVLSQKGLQILAVVREATENITGKWLPLVLKQEVLPQSESGATVGAMFWVPFRNEAENERWLGKQIRKRPQFSKLKRQKPVRDMLEVPETAHECSTNEKRWWPYVRGGQVILLVSNTKAPLKPTVFPPFHKHGLLFLVTILTFLVSLLCVCLSTLLPCLNPTYQNRPT